MNITLIIIGITSALSLYTMHDNTLKYKYTLNGPSIFNKKEFYRIITSAFVHADYAHLVFNMLSLYFFGEAAQMYYEFFAPAFGLELFIGLYLSSIAVANLPSLYKYKNSSYYHSLGASGAVAAVIFSTILFNPAQKIYLYFAFGIPGIVFGGLYLWYSAYAAKHSNDHINHDAHFYGAIWGIVYTLVCIPESMNSFIGNLSQLFR